MTRGRSEPPARPPAEVDTDRDSTAGRGRPDSRSVRARRPTELLVRADANQTAIDVIRGIRGLLPASAAAIAAPRTHDRRVSDRLAHLLAGAQPEEPSAIRELGLTAVQAWQTLVRRRPRSGTPVSATIVFTDLVGFSTWALASGDDQVLQLIGEVNAVSVEVISRRGGRVVKSLGDGMMAVFADPVEAIAAAHEAIGAVSALTIGGYRPQLRAGLHSGTPRAVGDDYLGVDVNIAARVAAAAGAGELLISDASLALVDPDDYLVRRRRRFKAKGVPRELTVVSIVPRYEN